MDAIFSALDLSTIATFIRTAGVIIVGIAMAFKGIELAKRAIASAGESSSLPSGRYFEDQYGRYDLHDEDDLYTYRQRYDKSFEDYDPSEYDPREDPHSRDYQPRSE